MQLLGAAPSVRVQLRLEDPQRRPSFRARTVVERDQGVVVAAHVFLLGGPTGTAAERLCLTEPAACSRSDRDIRSTAALTATTKTCLCGSRGPEASP